MTNCLTTKDAKYTKEEMQMRPQRAQRISFFVCREMTTNENLALLKIKFFAQSSSPDWAKNLTSAYSASLR